MRSERKKDGGRRRSICRDSVTERRNLLSRTFVTKERVTEGTEVRGQYATEHSK